MPISRNVVAQWWQWSRMLRATVRKIVDLVGRPGRTRTSDEGIMSLRKFFFLRK